MSTGPRALYISGNSGSGRRTLARKFYEDQYPHVGKIFARIEVSAFDGYEELFRTVLTSLRPSISKSQLLQRITSFSIATSKERARQIADLINSLLPAKEAAFLLDLGGVLTDGGEFASELAEVISLLEARPHPPVVFISPRAIPSAHRRRQDDVAYLPLNALKWDATNRLIARLLKQNAVAASHEQLSELTSLSECHPFNVYRIIDDVTRSGVSMFLANPGEFIDWKHRQSSEYVDKVKISEIDRKILGVLRIIPQLDFESIVLATNEESYEIQGSLQRLIDLHVIESGDNTFSVAPALRVAVERDRRTRLSKDEAANAAKTVSASLVMRIEEGAAPFNLTDSAILSSIEAGDLQSEFVGAFLLPSHFVWLSKQHYDQGNWTESIRFGQEALKGSRRLSQSGIVAACRFVCLAAARVGKEDIFQNAIKKLEEFATDDWAKSNVAYLKGFNLRNKGRLPAAEEFFKEAYQYSLGNHSALRELAAIALTRNNLANAETYAREALGHARSNPYLLDVMLSVLLRKYGKNSAINSEIDSLFSVLQKVGEEDGRSFFTTRRAEFELVCGNTKPALELIKTAISRTPSLFEPQKLYAQILLRDGNKVKAGEVLEEMRKIVFNNDRFDRRYNYRAYLQTLSEYYIELGPLRRCEKAF